MSDGKSRQSKAMQYKENDLAKMNIHFEAAKRPEKKEDAIETMRTIFDNCWFDEKECEQGLNCLKSFRKEWDDEKKMWSNKPVKDWSIHGADAFQTFAISQGINLGFFSGCAI